MMKKFIFTTIVFSLVSISAFSGMANAYWIWTPETKKFINPKYAVKDSPKEQFDWAMSFYNARDFQRAASEFEKLAKQYEFSEYASKAQYYVGLCYENMNKYYLAYQNYQKAIDNFPHIANTEEILAREFAIANLYLSKPSPKILGTDIMPPLDRAVEIFKKVVENAPYGKFAEESQFKLGEALKKGERYEEAVQAFHKIVEDYPRSKLATQAMYEESHCAYKASLRPAYDAAATDNAIKTFEKFVYKNKDADLAKNADITMKRLKDNVSEKSFRAGEFYEAQGKTQAAIIYYQDVIDTYPDSTFVGRAKARIEALRKKENLKAEAPIDLSKKKPEQIAREKKPWSPFRFKSQEKKTEVTARTIAAKEPPRKSPWNIFNLGAKKEPVAKEAVEKKPWKPFSFDSAKKTEPKKIPEAPVVVESPAATTQPVPQAAEVPKVELPGQPVEAPASVNAQKKEEAASPVSQSEVPKKNGWKPLSFGAGDPVVKKSHEKKAWKPLYFGTNDEPMATTNRRW